MHVLALYTAAKEETEENTNGGHDAIWASDPSFPFDFRSPSNGSCSSLTLLARAHRTHRTLCIAFVKRLVLRARCEMAANMGFSSGAEPHPTVSLF